MALVKEARKTGGIPTVKLLETLNRSKLVRATPAINRACGGQLYVPEEAPWLDEFLAELVQFTGDERQDAHDDQVDALAYGVICLDQTGTGQWWSDAEESPQTWRELYDFHLQGGGRPGMSNAERRGLYGLGRTGQWGRADERGLYGRGRRR